MPPSDNKPGDNAEAAPAAPDAAVDAKKTPAHTKSTVSRNHPNYAVERRKALQTQVERMKASADKQVPGELAAIEEEIAKLLEAEKNVNS